MPLGIAGSLVGRVWGSGGTPAPTVVSVTPDLDDMVGGGLRTLIGANFTGASAVTVNGVNVIGFTVISDTEIIAIMPAHPAGAGLSILVTTPAGTNAANTLFTYWSVTLLAASGLWDRGNYQDNVAGTWPGRPSAGTSRGRDLPQATLGYVPDEIGLEPSLNGASSRFISPLSVGDFFTAAAGTIVALVDPLSADAPSSAYDERSIVADAAGYMALTWTTSGFGVFIYDVGYKIIRAAPTKLRGLHLGVARWDGVNLGLAADGGAESTVACGNIGATAGAIWVGSNYSIVYWFLGKIRTLIFMPSKITDADAALVLRWAKACRGLEAA